MTEVIVIGGGVIGLSIARELSKSGIETIVLEKNDRAGDVTSSRNSGVIHAGIYYPEDYLKELYCNRFFWTVQLGGTSKGMSDIDMVILNPHTS